MTRTRDSNRISELPLIQLNLAIVHQFILESEILELENSLSSSTVHVGETLVQIILVISQYSIYEITESLVWLKTGFQGLRLYADLD